MTLAPTQMEKKENWEKSCKKNKKKSDRRLDVLNKKVSQVIKDWEDNDTVEHKTTFFPVPHQTMYKESL